MILNTRNTVRAIFLGTAILAPLEVRRQRHLPIRLFTPLEISSLTGRVGLLTGLSVWGIFGLNEAHAATISRPMQSLGLVGYWSFDVGKGGAKAVDMSGSGKTKNRLAAAFGGLNLVLPVLPTDISIGASAKSVKNSLWIS